MKSTEERELDKFWDLLFNGECSDEDGAEEGESIFVPACATELSIEY